MILWRLLLSIGEWQFLVGRCDACGCRKWAVIIYGNWLEWPTDRGGGEVPKDRQGEWPCE